jgi:serine/threonine protein kinase
MSDHDDSQASPTPRDAASRGLGDDATFISAPEPASRGPGPGGSSITPRFPEGRGNTADIGRVLEGTMLGPYRLDRFIGGGGMGAVFQALDTTLHRTVAIKVLAHYQSDDEENLKRFRNEAQSAARLDHENIGRVFAVGSDQGWHYIVLEYIEGINLRDLVREQGAFDSARTVDVTIQVAEALEHASERNVVHRDIKPSNIVMTPAGRPRIVDMGLARLHQVAGDAELTVSGMTLGTFDYISPEQARDPRDADVRSDLYSLGCTMFFMLAGRPPFADGTMVQKLLQHQQGEPPAIDEIRSDVPRRLAAIISRLMAKDPADRYQRPVDLVADLLDCAAEEGYSLSAPRVPTVAAIAMPRPGASRLPWVLPLVLLAGLVGVLWFRSTTVRTRTEDKATVESGTAPAPVEKASMPLPTAPPRVVADAESLERAIQSGGADSVIELDGDGPFDIAPFSIDGRWLTLRAAAGREPVVRIPPATDGTSIHIGDGSLSLAGIAVHLMDGPRSVTGRRALFSIAGGRFSCNAVVLRMPSIHRSVSAGAETASFIHVGTMLATKAPADTTLDFQSVRVGGDATLVAVEMPRGGRIDFQWNSGAALTRRLIAAEGARSGDVEIAVRLADVVAACGDGLVSLRDSPSLPRVPRLDMQATGCRFVVADPARAFIDQGGIAEPAAYVAALSWQDRHGRYEGTGTFQRIDGAAERVDTAFGTPGTPFVHDARVGSAPDPSAWAGWGD